MNAMQKPPTLVLLAAALALSACMPDKPLMPSFATDVRPILMAHCARCHGAGGTLQGDPGNYPLGNPPEGYLPGAPPRPYLDIFADEGDCVIPDGGTLPASCKVGALSYAPILENYFASMPPPPAAKLNDWEMDVVRRWGKNPLP